MKILRSISLLLLNVFLLLSLQATAQKSAMQKASKDYTIEQIDSINLRKIYSKRDSIWIKNASTFINKILGVELVNKYLKFSSLYNSTPDFVAYETVSTKNAEGRNTIIVYFVAGTYSSRGLSTKTKFDKSQIFKSINGETGCTLFIGRHKAIEMARKSNFAERLKPWRLTSYFIGKTPCLVF